MLLMNAYDGWAVLLTLLGCRKQNKFPASGCAEEDEEKSSAKFSTILKVSRNWFPGLKKRITIDT